MEKKLFYFLFLAMFFIATKTNAQTYTDGTLTITITQPTPTSPAPSTTNPKNDLAIWIEDTSGVLLKTKMIRGSTSTDDHFPTWATKAGCSSVPSCLATSTTGCNKTDANTGATLSTSTTPTSFGTKTITWDGKNATVTANGTTVADGTYKLWIESSWQSSVASNTHNTIASYTFTKGDTQTTVTDNGTTNAYFTSVTLDWVPTVPLSTSEASKKTFVIYPNPTTDSFKVQGLENVENVKVFDFSGKLVRTLMAFDSYNLSGLLAGTYYVEVRAKGKTYYQKVIKK